MEDDDCTDIAVPVRFHPDALSVAERSGPCCKTIDKREAETAGGKSAAATRRGKTKSKTLVTGHLHIDKDVFDRWCCIGIEESLKTDTDIASYLIEQYDCLRRGSQVTACCGNCQAPLIICCVGCRLPTHHTILTSSSHSAPAGDSTDEHSVCVAEPCLFIPKQNDEAEQVSAKTSGEATVLPEKSQTLTQVGESFDQHVTEAQNTTLNTGMKLVTDQSRKRAPAKHQKPRAKPAGSNSTLCKVCGKNFSRTSDLKTHMRIHTGEKPFMCKHCNAAFALRHRLTAHERIHTGEKPYVCEVCGQAFRKAEKLKVHRRTHTGERPYTCKDCGAAFKQFYTLKVHTMSHTGERPFVCEECGAGFTQSPDLRVHMRIHTGEKPFKCSQCGAGYRKSSNLKVHIRTHTGDRPYKCQECSASFMRSHHLTKHAATHSCDGPYVCKQCHATFSRHQYLKRHLVTHSTPSVAEPDVQDLAVVSVYKISGHTHNLGASEPI